MSKKLLDLTAFMLVSMLVACAPDPAIDRPSSTVSLTIPPRPREVQAQPLNVQVVTKDNLAQLQTQVSQNPKSVFLILSPQDYEALVNNVGEMRRFIEQQTGLIQYYETTLQALQKSPQTQPK